MRQSKGSIHAPIASAVYLGTERGKACDMCHCEAGNRQEGSMMLICAMQPCTNRMLRITNGIGLRSRTLGRRSGALRAVGAPTASMLAATEATEGDCTMPPKLMWPESALCDWPLHRAQRGSVKASQLKGGVAEHSPCEWLLHHLTHRRHTTSAPACIWLCGRRNRMR